MNKETFNLELHNKVFLTGEYSIGDYKVRGNNLMRMINNMAVITRTDMVMPERLVRKPTIILHSDTTLSKTIEVKVLGEEVFVMGARVGIAVKEGDSTFRLNITVPGECSDEYLEELWATYQKIEEVAVYNGTDGYTWLKDSISKEMFFKAITDAIADCGDEEPEPSKEDLGTSENNTILMNEVAEQEPATIVSSEKEPESTEPSNPAMAEALLAAQSKEGKK